MTAEKRYDLIRGEYGKRLLAEHKANFCSLNNGLSYFITYLRFLRDYYTLSEPNGENNVGDELKMASLTAAVSEYDSYRTCIAKYYKQVGNAIEKTADGTDEEVLKRYNSEREFHWVKFWQLVMTNIEGWTVNG